MALSFNSEEISFKLKHPRITTNWIKTVLQKEKRDLGALNYVFCSDEFLLRLNQQFLRHNTLTDILTFNYSDQPNLIEGDIFISVPRVTENAKKFSTLFDSELHRVIIHGVLHLIGYGDKTGSQKAEMRKKEDAYLSLWGVSRGTRTAR